MTKRSFLVAILSLSFACAHAPPNYTMMQQIFQERMAKRRVNAGIRFGIPNIPWAEVAELTPDQQQALKTALGVDALVVVRETVQSGRQYGFGAGGEGSFEVYPKSTLAFAIYDGTGSAIWKEPAIQGENAQSSVKRNMGVVDVSTEPKAVAEATGLAADALVQKYLASRPAVQPTTQPAPAPAPAP
jgi:hypothetical protein